MDRGEGQEDNLASAPGLEGVAAGASARVGEILAEAEQHAHDANAEAEREAAGIRRAAEYEAEQIAADTREAARAAARERAAELAALQSALTARGPAVVEGLEGAGLTRARLEAVIEALAAAAERVTAEAEEGDPSGSAEAEVDSEPEQDAAEASASEAGEASAPEPEPEPESELAPEPETDPVAAAEDLAKPLPDKDSSDHADHEADGAADDSVLNRNGHHGAPAEPVAYDGPLPEGAPLARRPLRSRERDARFAALLLAVQGRPRDEVEDHLRNEYGFDDVASILDEVFGRTPA